MKFIVNIHTPNHVWTIAENITRREAFKIASYTRKHGHSTMGELTAEELNSSLIEIYNTKKENTIYMKQITRKLQQQIIGA
jgi:hypothetical protein